jgi:ABC-type amino acid transport substrate-binding protein
MNMNPLIDRRFLCLSFFLMLTLAGSAQAQLQGDTYASAKQKGEARVIYYYNETPGYVSREANGTMKGLCIDLMQAFGLWLKKYEDIELKPVYNGQDAHDFKRFLLSMQQAKGGVFGVGSTTITEERKKNLQFSPPFLTNLSILITHADAPTLKAKKDIAATFSGMQALAVKGTTNEQWLLGLKKEFYPSLNLQYVASGEEALRQIVKNPKLFTQQDFIFYLNAKDSGLPIKRQAVADETSQHLGILLPLNSDWAPLMERFMKAFVGSNEYRRIVSRNLGPHALKLLDSVGAAN